jgi:UDP-N-acetylglucosamine 2-epimerase (non-hydrolysing)
MHVVGARPNFMKIAPLVRRISADPDFSQILVHTGQHYDATMSDVFFDELELPRPDINLSVGSGTHACQTAKIMMTFEPVVVDYKPDWVCVPGDVNSTLACALVCSKLGFRVAHVEAGLRSYDRSMPEEINRVLTDQVADLLLTPSRDANENLLKEGIPAAKIRFVGNIMIDTLIHLLPKAEQRWPALRERLNLGRYALATLHRPSNVDSPGTFQEILAAFGDLSGDLTIVFPVHPRTRQRIEQSALTDFGQAIRLVDPLGYLDFLALQVHATLVLTDSGGVQEETTYLGIPCLTLRPNTERPITVTEGTNSLVASERNAILHAAGEALSSNRSAGQATLEFWDGSAAARIIEAIRAA